MDYLESTMVVTIHVDDLLIVWINNIHHKYKYVAEATNHFEYQFQSYVGWGMESLASQI